MISGVQTGTNPAVPSRGQSVGVSPNTAMSACTNSMTQGAAFVEIAVRAEAPGAGSRFRRLAFGKPKARRSSSCEPKLRALSNPDGARQAMLPNGCNEVLFGRGCEVQPCLPRMTKPTGLQDLAMRPARAAVRSLCWRSGCGRQSERRISRPDSAPPQGLGHRPSQLQPSQLQVRNRTDVTESA